MLTYLFISAVFSLPVLVTLTLKASGLLIKTLRLGEKASQPPVLAFLFGVNGKPAPHVTLVAHTLITFAVLQTVAVCAAMFVALAWPLLLVFSGIKLFVDFWNGGREPPADEKENKEK